MYYIHLHAILTLYSFSLVSHTSCILCNNWIPQKGMAKHEKSNCVLMRLN